MLPYGVRISLSLLWESRFQARGPSEATFPGSQYSGTAADSEGSFQVQCRNLARVYPMTPTTLGCAPPPMRLQRVSGKVLLGAEGHHETSGSRSDDCSITVFHEDTTDSGLLLGC